MNKHRYSHKLKHEQKPGHNNGQKHEHKPRHDQ